MVFSMTDKCSALFCPISRTVLFACSLLCAGRPKIITRLWYSQPILQLVPPQLPSVIPSASPPLIHTWRLSQHVQLHTTMVLAYKTGVVLEASEAGHTASAERIIERAFNMHAG